MSASLRSRLWLSYALLVGAALGVVAVVLFVYLIRNPSIYRQANLRLAVIAAGFQRRQDELVGLELGELAARLDQVAASNDIRLLAFTSDRQLIHDTRAGAPALDMPSLPRLNLNGIRRDALGGRWIYLLRQLEGGAWLMAAVPRPSLPWFSILNDEFLPPLLAAGGVALALSLLLAYGLARWIGLPLQQVIAAARRMGTAASQPVPPRGPGEVQELARSFNDMRARLLASQESQRAFVANVSHELKTPLTSIQGFAQALQDGTAGSPQERRQAAQVILQEAERMHRMVLDLLDLARLDAGTLELRRDPVHLEALLNGLVEKFGPQARRAGVEIRVAAAGLPVLPGDGDRLAQVFSNLVDNALHFSPSGGCIRLQASVQGGNLSVQVGDDGPGIPADAQAHIFERFYQVDPSRAGGGRHGSGLGLAIAREIVQAHGGTISVRSVAGQGSTFTVHLPLGASETIPAARRDS